MAASHSSASWIAIAAAFCIRMLALPESPVGWLEGVDKLLDGH